MPIKRINETKQSKMNYTTNRYLWKMRVDIVGSLPITREGNRYIVVAMDYFSRWPEARSLKAANSNTVATFLYEKIICRFGASKIL